jgi:ABC-type glutathione transport system ATPase component
VSATCQHQDQRSHSSLCPISVQGFLSSEEATPTPELSRAAPGEESVRMRGAVTWARDLPPVLNYVDFTARAGQLVVIVGATGSGKSTFLSALLGLTEVMEDTHVVVRGKLSYVSQQAYIFGGATLPSSCTSRSLSPHLSVFQAVLLAVGSHRWYCAGADCRSHVLHRTNSFLDLTTVEPLGAVVTEQGNSF